MEKIKIPFGRDHISWTPTADYVVEMVHPQNVPGVSNTQQEILNAIENPIGGKKLEEFSGAKTAVIAISDLTRPVPNKLILPPIIEKLERMGIEAKNICIIVGAGLHRPSFKEEFKELIGEELVERVMVISHDAQDKDMLANLGETSRGTPVLINKHYLKADLKILTGMIAPHQFAGYSGGAKGLAIGLGGKKLIQTNHAMLLHEDAELGKISGNPAREDMDEIGEIAGIDFIVNVILNNEQEIVNVVAGDYKKAYIKGVELAQKIFEVPVEGKADVIIVSPGGFPKDLNLYQAQKALYHAANIIKDGGYLLLVAECLEGAGNDKFLNTMKKFKKPDEVVGYFKSIDFEIGVHKAFLWCKPLLKAKAYILSQGIDEENANVLMIKKTDNIESFLSDIKENLPINPKIYVMPMASSTIPVLQEA